MLHIGENDFAKNGLTHQVPEYIDGLVQDCSNSSANALELLQSCTKPWICNLHLIITVPADIAAPDGTRASADTVLTTKYIIFQCSCSYIDDVSLIFADQTAFSVTQ